MKYPFSNVSLARGRFCSRIDQRGKYKNHHEELFRHVRVYKTLLNCETRKITAWKKSRAYFIHTKRKSCSMTRVRRRGTTANVPAFAECRARKRRDINRMWKRECLPGDTMYPCCPSVSFDIDNHPPHCCTSITTLSSRIDCLSDWKVSQHDFPYEILGCTLPCATSTHSRRYRRFSSCGWKIDLRDANEGLFFRQFLLPGL